MTSRTELEKINARAIAANIEIFVEQTTGFEAQLGEIMPAIIAHEH